MGIGAIVVVGAELETIAGSAPQASTQQFAAEPLECIDILGRSMLERTVERFVRSGTDNVAVFVSQEASHAVQPFSVRFENVEIHLVSDVRTAVTQKLYEYGSGGLDHAFVGSAALYTETDLLDLFYFHREARQAATRAYDFQLPLNLWVVDCEKAQDATLDKLLRGAPNSGVSYIIRDYVSRTTHPRDVRRFVSDVLRGRCGARPSGAEAKPGIWIDQGVEIHRRARIVAPAYIGRGSKVMEDTLITRCSSMEASCSVEYGTVIEDSSVLAQTQVGIWLDVRHAVGSGNKLFNLERNVILEISDPSIMRSTRSARQESRKILEDSREPQYVDACLRTQGKEKTTPAPESWQFGANPIRG